MFLMRRKIIGARLRAAIKRAEAAKLGALEAPIGGLAGILHNAETDAQTVADRLAAEIAAERAAAGKDASTANADAAIVATADTAINANG